MMTKEFSGRSLRFAALALVVLALPGCSMFDDVFSSTPKPKLPGVRLSVMELEGKLEADSDLQEEKIVLPDAVVNKDWSQPGGVASNDIQHPSGGGALEELWKVNAGSGSSRVARLVATPVVADGKIFVLDAEATVRAFDAKSGQKLWEKDLTPEDEDSEKARGGGVAYDSGKVFVATAFGEAFALDAATGEQKWKANGGVPFRASPTVAEGHVFVITSDNQLLSLNEADGKTEWTHRGISESAGILAATSAAVADSIVVAPYSSGELFALRVENGTMLWSDSLTRTGTTTSLSALNDIAGRPVIIADSVIAVSHSGRLVSIDKRTGERVWTKDIASVQTPWVVGDYIFVLTIDQTVAAVSRRDGRVYWTSQLDRYEDMEDKEDPITWSGPLLVGDKLLFVSSTGKLAALSPETGAKKGEEIDLPGKTLIAPIVADGIVYVLTDDADLVALR